MIPVEASKVAFWAIPAETGEVLGGALGGAATDDVLGDVLGGVTTVGALGVVLAGVGAAAFAAAGGCQVRPSV